MNTAIKPMPIGLVPHGFMVAMGGTQHHVALIESRWKRQPEHLSTSTHVYNLRNPQEVAAVGIVHPDFADYQGITRLDCLKELGVITHRTTKPLDDFEFLVIDHLADCVRLNRMACRYPYMDVKGDGGDVRPGWMYNKYIPHPLESYVEVMYPEYALFGTLRIQKKPWRKAWLGIETRLWPQDLKADLLDTGFELGMHVFYEDQFNEFVSKGAVA